MSLLKTNHCEKSVHGFTGLQRVIIVLLSNYSHTQLKYELICRNRQKKQMWKTLHNPTPD